ncbi:uncharacterized protein LOC112454460 isoform X1 [Temnothorax curvispinosus]|uniref:Uncharacterized protein LOC112454460 isoform X1 n=1 Tax=Temnothorax curvispinosus TaxID=300111 RepID=A0A6J1PPJ6_9HYME|nr:uncharacterized protein LOC112454460 isoform X1 [Temnothorax curvispinosus]
MTKDYEKARDIGSQLLKRNRNDVDITRALNILKNKSQCGIFLSFCIPFPIQIYSIVFYFMLTEHEECERSSLIESKCEGSDATDGNDTDFIGGSADIHIDPEMASKIASCDMSRLSNEAKNHLAKTLDQKMHRVIPIKMSKVTHIKDLTKR